MNILGGSWLTATGSQSTPASLGKDDFLKLLLAQLRNQDPLKPMEDRDFIVQLAQFNQLEQMQQINESLTAIVARDQIAQASALLGKRVEVFSPQTGTAIEGLVTEVRVLDGLAMLEVGGELVPLEFVRRIKAAGDV